MQRKYASFSDRLSAIMVDYFIICFLSLIVYHLGQFNEELVEVSIKEFVFLSSILFYRLLYSPIMESTGGTMGKRMYKLQVVSIHSLKPPNFFQTFVRSNFFIGSALIIYLILKNVVEIDILYFFSFPLLLMTMSPFFIFVTGKRRTIEDKLASVLVLKRGG